VTRRQLLSSGPTIIMNAGASRRPHREPRKPSNNDTNTSSRSSHNRNTISAPTVRSRSKLEESPDARNMRILNKFHNTSNTDLYVEYSKLKLKKNEFIKIYSALLNVSSHVYKDEIVEHRYIQNSTNKSRYTFFSNGVKIPSLNVNLTKTFLIPSVRQSTDRSIIKYYELQIVAVTNSIDDNVPGSGGIVDVIISNKFETTLLPNWIIHLDLVKTFDATSFTFRDTFKSGVKNLLKKYSNYPDDINMDDIDFVRIKLIYNNNKNKLELTIDMVIQAISTLLDIINPEDTDRYQQSIYNMSKYLYNPSMQKSFKHSGFKRLVNNVRELNRYTYFNTILPNISNFYLTDKIDGIRCFVIITEQSTGINIKILSNKLYTITLHGNDTTLGSIILDTNKKQNMKTFVSVFDAEMIYDAEIMEDETELDINLLQVYVFDVMVLDNINHAMSPFNKRFEYFSKAQDKLQKYKLGTTKKFIKLTSNYKEEIQQFYDESNNNVYDIDGLIFTPGDKFQDLQTSSPTSSQSKSYTSRIEEENTKYNNMIVYKWKPENKLSIDFYLVKIPSNMLSQEPYKSFLEQEMTTDANKSGNSLYILCSGINLKIFNLYKMKLFNGYKSLVNSKFHNRDYFPIQFSPDGFPNLYMYLSDIDSLDGKVGEFIYTTVSKKQSWKLIKVRNDRDADIAKGEYFGNALKYSELIWRNILHPLTFNDLQQDVNDVYFSNVSLDSYKGQRNFNSIVKTELLKCVTNRKLLSYPSKRKLIMDLACGKGQDLSRLINLRFENIVMIDKDFDAIYQLLERKYNIRLQDSRSSSTLKSLQMDLSSDYNANIDILKNNTNILKESVDIIICNFALHYFMDDFNHINNLIQLISYYLSPNGRFIFTCFDGAKVFELLKSTNTFNWIDKKTNELKYSIDKRFDSDVLTNLNQKIGVILPFTNKTYYDEYLVNLDYIESLFNKHGIHKEMYSHFDTILPKAKKNMQHVYNNLSDIDKEFISLYSYNIYIKSNTINEQQKIQHCMYSM